MQDEEARDTCVKLHFAGARRGISAAIDTGAGINVLPTRVYRIVFPHVTIQPTNIKLSAYNNTPIADDIKIHGRTEREHGLTLLHVLDMSIFRHPP